MAKRLTTRQAAARAGLSPSGLRSLIARARARGVALYAPRADWPDARTPMVDGRALDAYLAARPGRGRKPGAADRGK